MTSWSCGRCLGAGLTDRFEGQGFSAIAEGVMADHGSTARRGRVKRSFVVPQCEIRGAA